MEAVDLAIDSCTFFPTISELIENIKSQRTSSTTSNILIEPKPTPDETNNVKAMLAELICAAEKQLTAKEEKRLQDRKTLLREQAKKLGVNLG